MLGSVGVMEGGCQEGRVLPCSSARGEERVPGRVFFRGPFGSLRLETVHRVDLLLPACV